MAFTQSISHLFNFTASGRKLRSPKRQPVEHVEQAGAASEASPATDGSMAAAQASIYLRGLMEAKTGDRNLEDIADTVPGGDHQQIHHFVSNSPWVDAHVLDWVSREVDGRLGELPDS